MVSKNFPCVFQFFLMGGKEPLLQLPQPYVDLKLYCMIATELFPCPVCRNIQDIWTPAIALVSVSCNISTVQY